MRPALLATLLLLLPPLRAAEVSVFAAASLSDALGEIARAHEAASGDRIRLNLAASSTLALQIRQGAPADVFFSADEARMDELGDAGLLAGDTRRNLLSNSLVIVVNAEGGAAVASPADLARPSTGRIALAEPNSVPAGIYAREWLQKIDLWGRIMDRVLPAENVRAALSAVEAGNVGAAIVYRTDALISRRVRIVHEVPAAEGPRISYPVAVLKDSRQPDAARRFAAHLASPAARAVFVRFGFLPAP